MRVLVTGHSGHVGAPVARQLASSGHEIVGFDRAEGADLLDSGQVRRAAEGCAAVVHLGALPHDTAGSPEQIMAVNVLGTWHVLLAAGAAGMDRVVCFSSGQALGIAEGERQPDYFPVDDAHPRRAMRPYGLSKVLGEDLCAGFTARTGIPSVSLRPVWVWDPGQYQRIEERWQADPRSEWEPFWEYGAFVDGRDVATAVELALTVPVTGHHRALLCAADIAGTAPSLELAGRIAPGVPVRDPARWQAEPMRGLFDCSAAAELLGWRPRFGWANRGADAGGALDRFPAPAVVVLADDLLAVSGDAAHAVVVVTAVFPRLVARAFVADRVARRRSRSRRRRGDGLGGGRLGRCRFSRAERRLAGGGAGTGAGVAGDTDGDGEAGARLGLADPQTGAPGSLGAGRPVCVLRGETAGHGHLGVRRGADLDHDPGVVARPLATEADLAFRRGGAGCRGGGRRGRGRRVRGGVGRGPAERAGPGVRHDGDD